MLYLNVHDSSTSNSRQRLEARGSLAADKRIKEIPYKHAVKFSHKEGRVWILTAERKSPETIVSILAENSYPQILRTWMLNRLCPFRFFKSLSSQMVFSSVFKVSVFSWESCSEENRERERISSDHLAFVFFFFPIVNLPYCEYRAGTSPRELCDMLGTNRERVGRSGPLSVHYFPKCQATNSKNQEWKTKLMSKEVNWVLLWGRSLGVLAWVWDLGEVEEQEQVNHSLWWVGEEHSQRHT